MEYLIRLFTETGFPVHVVMIGFIVIILTQCFEGD